MKQNWGGKRQNPPGVKLHRPHRAQIQPEFPIFEGESSRSTLFSDPYVFLQTLFWAFLPQSGGLRLRILGFTVGGAGAAGAGAGRGVWKKHLRDTAPPPRQPPFGVKAVKMPVFSHLSTKPIVFRIAPHREGGDGVGGVQTCHAAHFGGPSAPPTGTTAPQHPRNTENRQKRPKSAAPPPPPTPNRVILVNRGFGARQGYLPPSRTKRFGVFCLNFFVPPSLAPTLTARFGGKSLNLIILLLFTEKT